MRTGNKDLSEETGTMLYKTCTQFVSSLTSNLRIFWKKQTGEQTIAMDRVSVKGRGYDNDIGTQVKTRQPGQGTEVGKAGLLERWH